MAVPTGDWRSSAATFSYKAQHPIVSRLQIQVQSSNGNYRSVTAREVDLEEPRVTPVCDGRSLKNSVVRVLISLCLAACDCCATGTLYTGSHCKEAAPQFMSFQSAQGTRKTIT